MRVKEPSILSLIDKIAEHYTRNISNRYLRKAFMSMTLSNTSWDLIDSMTKHADYYRLQGYHFDELYNRVLALARFIYHARRDIAPNLRSILGGGASVSGNEKIIRDMALNNFSSNLSILSDMVNELYMKTVELDMEANKESPAYKKNPELAELGRYLIGS